MIAAVVAVAVVAAAAVAVAATDVMSVMAVIAVNATTPHALSKRTTRRKPRVTPPKAVKRRLHPTTAAKKDKPKVANKVAAMNAVAAVAAGVAGADAAAVAAMVKAVRTPTHKPTVPQPQTVTTSPLCMTATVPIPHLL